MMILPWLLGMENKHLHVYVLPILSQVYVHLCRVRIFATPWTGACQASLSFTISVLKLMSTESMMPSNHLSSCPQIFSSIKVFSNESALRIRWPKYWSFILHMNIQDCFPFRTDWFDLFALQGTLESLLRHRNLKASILRRSALLTVQLSHPYRTTGKIMALTI